MVYLNSEALCNFHQQLFYFRKCYNTGDSIATVSFTILKKIYIKCLTSKSYVILMSNEH